VKERPILFSGEMVRALLAGKKTQTRRLVKSQPMMGMVAGRPDLGTGWIWQNGKARFNNPCDEKELADAMATHKGVCPYGTVGDRLWVRETWAWLTGNGKRCVYRADADPPMSTGGVPVDGMKWTPSIYMRRTESRITLEVKSVRVERLQSIDFVDIRAEGVACPLHDFPGGFCASECSALRGAFSALWDSINGDRAPFASNPWVWVVSFERVATKGSAE